MLFPYFQPYYWPVYLFALLAGLALGSFLNVAVSRLPRGESIVAGRSRCESCGRTLTAFELVPVLSYALLGGKCHGCGARLSLRYPLAELLGGACCVLPLLCFGLRAEALLFVLFFLLLLFTAFLDWDTQIIPDFVPVCIAGLGLARLALGAPLAEHLIGALAASLPMLAAAYFLHGFGYGDVKLMAAAGLLLGWKLILVALFFGVVLGGGYGALLLAGKRATGKSEIAFGPFLCVGLCAAGCFGNALISWYLSLIF